MSDVVIRLRPEGDSVTLALGAFLGPRFQLYREAVASVGGRYNASERVNVLPLAQVPAALPALHGAGLSVSVDPDVAAKLRQEADAAKALASEGEKRLALADERLRGTGRSLYPYQRSGVRWLAPRPEALLADQMGLGKTVQALLALPDGAPVMVVCPAAVLLSWKREVETWRPDLYVSILKSRAQWRWPLPGEVVLSTYGLLPVEDQLPAPVGTVLVGDEAHLLKNPKTARTKAWRALHLNVRQQSGKTWLLTGTPLLNRPPELWAVLGAAGLTEASFGSWARFAAMFDGSKGKYGYEWGGDVSPEAPLALQKVSLHRRREEVLPDLPTKRHVTREVNGLPAATIRACDAVVDALRAKGIDLDRLDENADLGKLISGPVFELLSKARAQLATAKIPHALELVESYEESDEPLVVVSAHREPVQVVGSRDGWAAITGETPAEERGRIAQDFQDGKLRGVALTYKAGGVGITLTRAAHMVLVDLDWTPALIQQAEDRIVRIGQKRGCLITRIVATHPLDQRVCELLSAKQALIDATVEASAVEAAHVHEDPALRLAEAAEAAAAITEAAPPPQEQQERRAFTAETLEAGGDAVGKFRPPTGDVELWAGRGVLILAALDPDMAADRNEVGFNGTDTSFGHSLAESLAKYGRLSDRQWEAAVRMMRKYHRQVGEMPMPAPARRPNPDDVPF